MKNRKKDSRFSLFTRVVLVSLLMSFFLTLQAQNERKVIRQGVKSYEQGDYSEAEVQFRKAADINHQSFEAGFNTGAALYGQEKYEETAKAYEELVDQAKDPGSMAHVWHNMGNSLLEAGNYQESIDAYKNSLRMNPGDQDTKYNLAYAKKKLQDQQQQQQNKDQDQQQNKDQDQQQNKDQDQQQNKDQDQQQNKDQDQQQNKDQDQQQSRPQPQQISKEDAERMLSAIQQQEKDVKDKVDKKKAAVAKVKTEKDW